MVQLLESEIQTREVLSWQGVHLLHFSGSTCSQKTRIFLNLKGINWTSHHVNLIAQDNYKPWFLGISPRGLVPVLVHDGMVHIESNDILAYLEDTFPSPALIPGDQREDIIAALHEEDELHLDIRCLTMRFIAPKVLVQKKPASLQNYEDNLGTLGGEPDPHKAVEIEFWKNFAARGITDEQVSTSLGKFRSIYERLEKQLRRSPYLCGSDITLVDIAWFIYTFRLSAVGYPFSSLHPAVYGWYQGLMQRPEFAREVQTPLPLKMATASLGLFNRFRGSALPNFLS